LPGPMSWAYAGSLICAGDYRAVRPTGLHTVTAADRDQANFVELRHETV
jgi:hypothetical protein